MGMISILTAGINFSRVGNMTGLHPAWPIINGTQQQISVAPVAHVASTRDHMEILIELRYWMVLILVFSLLSMLYVGLVLCFHLIYCVKTHFRCFPDLQASVFQEHRRPEVIRRSNAPGNEHSLLQILDETSSSQHERDVALAFEATLPPPSYENLTLGVPPPPPPISDCSCSDIQSDSESLPDYATAVQTEIATISSGVEFRERLGRTHDDAEGQSVSSMDASVPLTAYVINLINRLSVYT